MKQLKEPVNSDNPSNVIVYIFNLAMAKKIPRFQFEMKFQAFIWQSITLASKTVDRIRRV